MKDVMSSKFPDILILLRELQKKTEKKLKRKRMEERRRKEIGNPLEESFIF